MRHGSGVALATASIVAFAAAQTPQWYAATVAVPAPHSGGAVAHDSVRGRIVLGGTDPVAHTGRVRPRARSVRLRRVLPTDVVPRFFGAHVAPSVTPSGAGGAPPPQLQLSISASAVPGQCIPGRGRLRA